MNAILTDSIDLVIPRHLKPRELGALILTFVAYVTTSQIGTFLYNIVGTSPATIWAPVGIALAAIILGGYRMVPAILWGAFIAGLLHHIPPFLLGVSVFANVLEGVIAYQFLKRFEFDWQLSGVKDMFLLITVCLFITMIVPTLYVGAVSLLNLVYGTAQPVFWLYWWVGSALSAVVIAPLLIRWAPSRPRISSYALLAENVAAFLFVLGSSYFLFSTTATTIFGISFFYPLLLGLVWAAFRGGPLAMSLTIFGMAVISLYGTLYGVHTPPERALNDRLFTIEAFDLLLATLFFMLVSVEEQRKTVILALKKNTIKLENAFAEIQEKEEAKNEFIAILAHELRNPLATLLSSAELLSLDSKIKGESAELVGIMQSRILTMSRLLNDLLDIARITRKEITIRKEKAGLSGIVRRTLETVGHAIQRKNQTLSVSLPIETVVLEADPIRMEQALVNLLYNAVKYTPENGHIDLTAKYHNGIIAISVSDTGIGIPDDMLSRIFDPFVQVIKGAPSKMESIGTGLGIGLSLTKNLIELHGGTIEARRNPQGAGSEFLVKLPASIDADPRPIEPAEHHIAQLGKRTKNGLEILVVDDNVAAAESLSKLLALKGHRVSIATSGKEALSTMPKRKPHAIVLDLGLGDMDGCDVAREIRKDNNESVLIALTGYGQERDKQRTQEAGFQFHMTKPVGLAEIEAVLVQITAA